ncbi:hypothetical protein K443DRAFT_678539 [Laccaria amethystina LaAM-08-1]|uniref:Cytochrome c oxidase assembly protein COX16, mitochondrial n=1 Tax=Laccaria amethystina LaAM-08-1 TaxID=1095629 RepID=A0A0C9XID3_9AGAR|nr:hypothetical protein K443DRAFT_678539 [Laccaria amethystina LaAM-08-1]
MAVFPSRPVKPSSLNQTVRRNPALFGVPFVLLMVVASYGLSTVTQTRYDLHDQKVKHVTKEQELKLDRNRKKFDIREEYFKLSAQAEEEWEPRRIPRPKGVPEWGVPPTEPPPKSSEPLSKAF